MSELKPCPFCGCAATYVKHSAGVPGTQGFDKWDAVACKHCRATIGACDRRFRNREDAAEIWNRRTQPEATAPAQDLSAAILAMNRAKLLPIWDNDVPHKLHVELDVIFKALAALASPADALVAGDRVDAERWRMFTKALRTYLPGPGHGVRIKVVEICPMYGEETEVENLEKLLDRAIQAQKDGHG